MIFGKDRIWRKQSTEGTVATNGDYEPGTETWSQPEACDVLPNGKANTVTLPDGTRHAYAYEISLDPDCGDFQVGDVIRLQEHTHALDMMALSTAYLTDAEAERVRVRALREYAVLGFHRYMTVAKIWV